MAFNPMPGGWFTPTGSPGSVLSWDATSSLSPQAALGQAQQGQTYSTQGYPDSGGGSGPGGTTSAQEWEANIAIMREAMAASSGINRDRLAAEINNAEQARQNALEIARLQAETSRYGIDQQRQTAIEQRIEQARQFDQNHLEQIRQFDLTFGEQGRQFDLELQERVAGRLQSAEQFRQQLEFNYGRAYADDWFRNEQLKIAQGEHNLQQARLGLDYASTYAELAGNSADPWALADWQAGLSQTSAGQDVPVYLQRLAEGITTPAFQAPAAGGGPGTMDPNSLFAANGVAMPSPTGAPQVGNTPMPQFQYSPTSPDGTGAIDPNAGRVPGMPSESGGATGVREGGSAPGMAYALRSTPGAPEPQRPMYGAPIVNAAANAMSGPPAGMTYHGGKLVPISQVYGAGATGQPATTAPRSNYTPQQTAILQRARDMLQEGPQGLAPQALESLSPLQGAQLKSTLDRAGGRGAADEYIYRYKQSRIGQSIGSAR